jgi:murein DD-endopeptidase MepM/ murein hydrolase activator NlpD
MHRVLSALLFVCAMAPVAHAGDPPVPLQSAVALLSPPVPHACISSPFGMRHRIGFLPAGMHNGLDIPAPAGATVHAVAAGQVMGVHHRGPGGLELLISHDNGHVVTIYSHLGSVAPEIAFGKTNIKVGDRLGVVGHSGVTYGMHLYFEVLVDGKPVDPAPLLGLRPCG